MTRQFAAFEFALELVNLNNAGGIIPSEFAIIFSVSILFGMGDTIVQEPRERGASAPLFFGVFYDGIRACFSSVSIRQKKLEAFRPALNLWSSNSTENGTRVRLEQYRNLLQRIFPLVATCTKNSAKISQPVEK